MNRSLQLALRIGSRYAEGNARLILGYILNQARKYESAIRESMLASEAFRSVGVVPGAADALLNAAGIYGDCGEVSTSERLLEELDPLALERNLYVFRSTFQRGDLLLRAGRLVEAEAYLRAAREQAPNITPNWIAPTALSLSLALARSGQVEEARKWLDEALALLAPLKRPALAIEARAVSARLRAGLGDAEAAREDAEIAATLAGRFEANHFSDKAWHLAAAYALLSDDAKAMHLAQAAAWSFVNDALGMGPALVEAYARAPWHRHCIAFLAGRSVPLKLDEAE